MKTYYIVKVDSYLTCWEAHSGIFARLGFFSIWSLVSYSMSYKSADDCEQNLRREVSKKTYKVVRVVKI